MRKMLLIAGLLPAVLLVAVGVVAVMNANTLIGLYRGQLETVIGRALGVRVELGKVEVSLFPEAKFRIASLRLGDEGNFSLRDIELHTEILPLLKKELRIDALSLKSPSVTLVRDSQGIRIKGFPVRNSTTERKDRTENAEKAEAEKVQAEKLPEDSGTMMLVALKRVSVDGAQVAFEDELDGRSFRMNEGRLSAGLEVSGDSFRVPNIVISGRFEDEIPIEIRATGFFFDTGARRFDLDRIDLIIPESSFAGRASMEVPSGRGTAVLSESRISPAALMPLIGKFMPGIEAYAPTGTVKSTASLEFAPHLLKGSGAVDLRDVGASVRSFRISGLSGKIEMSLDGGTAALSTEKAAVVVNSMPAVVSAAVTMKGDEIGLEKVLFEAFSGRLEGRGTFPAGRSSRPFTVSVAGSGLDAGKLVEFFTTNTTIAGTVSRVVFDAGGEVGANLKQSLRGKGNLEVVDGMLKGINILGKVLTAVDNMPFMKGSLLAQLPPEQQKGANSPDTEFSLLRCRTGISDNRIRIEDGELRSDLFRLLADGSISFDADIDLRATIILTPELSQRIGDRVIEIKKVLAADGTLTIPLQIKGKGKNIIVLPDVKGLMEIGARKVIKEEAGKLLEKAIGGHGGSGLGKMFGF